MRQVFAMTTVDDRAELEQVEGGIMCPLTPIVYFGCRSYPLPCPPPPCLPGYKCNWLSMA